MTTVILIWTHLACIGFGMVVIVLCERPRTLPKPEPVALPKFEKREGAS